MNSSLLINWGWESNIEFLDPRFLWKNDLKKIAEIEKDMWARSIWEYVKCDFCDKVFSKKDIFWHLSSDIYFKTVSEIEKIMWWNIECLQCWSSTSFIYDEEEYFDKTTERYQKGESFMTLFRDQEWIIRWFLDAYIGDIDVVYDRELESYYWKIWKWEIVSKIMECLSWNIPERLLAFASMWMEERYQNFLIVLKMLKKFYFSMEPWLGELWITELKIWSYLHFLYSHIWAIGLWFANNPLLENRHESVWSDLFIHPNVISDYQRELNMPVKQFLVKNKNVIRGIVS